MRMHMPHMLFRSLWGCFWAHNVCHNVRIMPWYMMILRVSTCQIPWFHPNMQKCVHVKTQNRDLNFKSRDLFLGISAFWSTLAPHFGPHFGHLGPHMLLHVCRQEAPFGHIWCFPWCHKHASKWVLKRDQKGGLKRALLVHTLFN